MLTPIRSIDLMLVFSTLGLVSAPVDAKQAETLATKSAKLTVEILVQLDNPWGMVFLPDGRLLISEKSGTLRIYADGKVSEPITGLPKVEFHDQGGLLDITIDPDFGKSGLVYFSYTERAEQQPDGAKPKTDPRLGKFVDEKDTVLKGTAVARGRLEGNKLENVIVIWRQNPKIVGLNHFGGRLVFSPDGKLFVTSGDRQSFDPAQDLSSNVGKVVRINPDGSIPEDNPFVGKAGTLGDIWSYGHRNPLGAAFEPSTGRLWVHEMAPKGGDEVNIIEKGRNYGWPLVSEGVHYDDAPIPRHATRPELAAPVRFWNPSISPSGLAFYDGALVPAWRGSLLLGGLSSKSLFRLTVEDGRITGEERIDMGRRIRDVIAAPDGSVMLLSDGDEGELLRLTATDKVTGAQ